MQRNASEAHALRPMAWRRKVGEILAPLSPSSSAEDLQVWLTASIAERLGVDPRDLDFRRPVRVLGIDGEAIMQLCREAESRVRRRIPKGFPIHLLSIRELARVLSPSDCGHSPGERDRVVRADAELVGSVGSRPASLYFCIVRGPLSYPVRTEPLETRDAVQSTRSFRPSSESHCSRAASEEGAASHTAVREHRDRAPAGSALGSARLPCGRSRPQPDRLRRTEAHPLEEV